MIIEIRRQTVEAHAEDSSIFSPLGLMHYDWFTGGPNWPFIIVLTV